MGSVLKCRLYQTETSTGILNTREKQVIQVSEYADTTTRLLLCLQISTQST